MDDPVDTALDAVLAANFPGLHLAPALQGRLRPLLRLQRLTRGRTLFAQDQGCNAFYAVVSGEIEARLTGEDGQVSVLEHVQAPRLFGLAAFATGRPAGYEALARRPSRLLVIGPAAYTLLMDEQPSFARALLREFALRFDGNLRLLEAARHRSAAQRFALALTQLTRERGLAADAEGWQAVAATQAELAALAHLSRQTVNQLLGEAVARGELRRGYGRLWVKPR
ncbi:Crp/Fnr family transcriptional regulator [Roseateles sp.]|jgi:CRP/FNR family cyclic AMP-dependent transcriptional regulator|uniref:Crp/Fnr family transcriptional regulator n=1 Tax=Roseateles sp. TaxID=1971397 RepID=UPI00391A7977